MYNIESMENSMSSIKQNGKMNSQERLLYILERLTQNACTTKDLAIEVFGNDESKHIRAIQNDVKLLKKRYPEKIVVPRKGYIKFAEVPDFMGKVMSNDVEDVSELFEFIALFDANMLKLFEEREPLFVKKLRREIKSIYYIKDDPIEEIQNKEIWKVLKKSVKDKRYLSISYKKDKLRAYNNIKPLKIVFARNNWYLAAINTEEKYGFEFTFFRINHIVSATLEMSKFHEDVEALKHLKSIQTLFQLYKEPTYPIRIWVKPEAAPYFSSKKYLHSQKIEKKHEDGSLEISFQINHPMEILPLVKRWLPHLVVMEPKSLHADMTTLLESYLK